MSQLTMPPKIDFNQADICIVTPQGSVIRGLPRADSSCLQVVEPKTDMVLNKDLNFSFNFEVDEKSRAELEKMIAETTAQQYLEFMKKVEEATEHICRNYVTPPIKGPMTKGKIRWRGLSLAWGPEETEFLGVIQRGVLIDITGRKFPLNNKVKFHKERIRCPNCGKVQTAIVEHLVPFNDYTHQCKSCGYWITESEWEKVD